MSFDSDAGEMEIDLDDWLERDERGLPQRLRLEVPFVVTVRVGGRSEIVTVDAFAYRRPPSDALDILTMMASNQNKSAVYMREFIVKLTSVPDHAEIILTERMLAKNLDLTDFYRAWGAAADFLPKQKKPAGPS